jgi:hypothetical protein
MWFDLADIDHHLPKIALFRQGIAHNLHQSTIAQGYQYSLMAIGNR